MADEQQAETSGAIVAYKAFNDDLTCRGHQFEIGRTYELTGKPEICRHGFHACENPFDVFNYYPLGSRVARVTMSGAIDHKKGDDQDSKICGLNITIDAEIRLPEIIKAAVAYVLRVAKGNTATGDSGHAAATGSSGHAAATGDRGHAAATGDRGHAAATGDRGHAAATGYSGHAAATGSSGHAVATGYSGHAAATGDSGHAAATGSSGHAAATGDRGHAVATGYSGHAAATGDSGHAVATGYSGHAAVKGQSAVAASLGIDGTAVAEAGGAISLACYEYNSATGRYDLIAVRSSLVGQNGVEAGKVYSLNIAGEFVEQGA